MRFQATHDIILFLLPFAAHDSQSKAKQWSECYHSLYFKTAEDLLCTAHEVILLFYCWPFQVELCGRQNNVLF